MSDVALILDSAAALAFSTGAVEVGEAISTAADQGQQVVLPALCLAEAYRRASSEGWALLEILENLANIRVTSVNPEDSRALGFFSRKLGSKHLAHTLLEATAHSVPGDEVTIMTAERGRITQVLAEEWPIIDL